MPNVVLFSIDVIVFLFVYVLGLQSCCCGYFVCLFLLWAFRRIFQYYSIEFFNNILTTKIQFAQCSYYYFQSFAHVSPLSPHPHVKGSTQYLVVAPAVL